MDIVWLFVAIVVIVIIVAGLLAATGSFNNMITPVVRAAVAQSDDPPPVSAPVQPNIARTWQSNPTSVSVWPPQPVSTMYGKVSQPPTTTDEEDGEVVPLSNTDTRYIMKSTYPGLRGDELILTKPLRRRIRLCESGGFLRSYDGREWRQVPYVCMEEHRVYYDKTGCFRVGDAYLRKLPIEHNGENYVLEVAKRH
jgi:hypothetical protein